MIAEKCKLFMPLRRQSWLAESNHQAYVPVLSNAQSEKCRNAEES